MGSMVHSLLWDNAGLISSTVVLFGLRVWPPGFEASAIKFRGEGLGFQV